LKISADDGAIDTAWNHQVDSDIHSQSEISALAVGAEGILVGGKFDHADEHQRAGLVALRPADFIFLDGFDPPLSP